MQCWRCSLTNGFQQTSEYEIRRCIRVGRIPLFGALCGRENKQIALASDAFDVALRERRDECSRVKTKAIHLFGVLTFEIFSIILSTRARELRDARLRDCIYGFAATPWQSCKNCIYIFLCLLCILQSLLFPFNPLCCTFSFFIIIFRRFCFLSCDTNTIEMYSRYLLLIFFACYCTVSFRFINLRSVPLVLVHRASLNVYSIESRMEFHFKSIFVLVTISPPRINTECSTTIVSCRCWALGAIIRAIILAQSVSLWFWLYIFRTHRRHLSAPAYE